MTCENCAIVRSEVYEEMNQVLKDYQQKVKESFNIMLNDIATEHPLYKKILQAQEELGLE